MIQNQTGGGSPGNSAFAVTINKVKYFNTADNVGYETHDEFLRHIASLTDSNKDHLRNCYGYLKQGLRTNGGTSIRYDVAGRQLDKTHQNDPFWPTQKGPLCQLKVTTFAKAK